MVLCRKGKQKDVKSVKVHVDGKEVSKLEAVKYLGVVIDKVLSWKQHIDGVRRKCYAKLIFFFFFKLTAVPSEKKQYRQQFSSSWDMQSCEY